MYYPKAFTLHKFRAKILINISLLVLCTLLGFYLIYSKESWPGILLTGLMFLYIVYNLFQVVYRTNRDLAHFLMSIQFDDYGSSFSTRSASYLKDDESLHQVFNMITGKFRNLISKKEAQHQFLISLVEQVDTGLICFDEQWQTVMMNRALKSMLHKSYIPSLKSILKIDKALHDTLIELSIGEKKLLEINVDESRLQLSILSSQMKMQGELIRIFVIQNISAELDNQEIRSWQKLIRILTHEIMNSVSPVVSLASTTNDMLAQTTHFDNEIISKMHRAIQAIKQRGESLMSFTERYRALTRIPPPKMQKVELRDLVDRITNLFEADLKSNNIELNTKSPNHNVFIQADASLLEQTFINLFKNSVEALADRPDGKIDINIYKDNRHTILQIADNGEGIEESMMDKIFIPFFTTKNEGSGIGLSLCRQIILMHGGTINVQSEFGKGSVFTVRLQ